jgi:hypothetical protein
MKTALTLITAAIVPGGLVVLGLALLGYLLARRNAGAIATHAAGPVAP